MNSLTKTACRRCREQKLKCSHELPQCARCLKFSVPCVYPDPPDRKMLAALRGPAERRAAKQNARASRRRPSNSRPVGGGVNDSDDDLGVSAEVQDFLQDIYFTCQFHATLLFHRPTFLRAFEEGQVPQPVLFAMFSNAAIFLPEKSPLYCENQSLLRPLGDLQALGRRWALHAGRTTLQSIDQPTFMSVQVCEMLAIYWFCQGEHRRHTMFLSIAYKAACVLGLDTKNDPGLLAGLDVNQKWLSAEMGRRCFWAIWFTQCINADNSLTDIIFNDRVMHLPLPISESSFLRTRPEEPFRSLSSMQNNDGIEPSGKPSILAELMGIMFYWAKIRRLLESRKRESPSAWLTEVFELETKLSRWRSRLPQSLQYAKRTLNDQLAANQQALYVMMHTIHHQSRLVLHASLVPQFSGLPLPEGIPPEVTSVSARIVWSSAEHISCLAGDLVTMAWDPAKVPAFVGYCLYAAASVHIAVLGVGDPALVEQARGHLISALKLLKSLKLYWSVLGKLWTRINILYATQMRHLRCTDVQTITASLFHSSMRPGLKDLDQLASEVRDPGQLAEPLADSVLEYSLRRLRPAAHEMTSRTAQGSNEATLEDQIEELLEGTPRASQAALAETNNLVNDVRMDFNMDNQAVDSHILSAAVFDPVHLLETTSHDNISPFLASWNSTLGFPCDANQNLFGLGEDLDSA